MSILNLYLPEKFAGYFQCVLRVHCPKLVGSLSQVVEHCTQVVVCRGKMWDVVGSSGNMWEVVVEVIGKL